MLLAQCGQRRVWIFVWTILVSLARVALAGQIRFCITIIYAMDRIVKSFDDQVCEM
jgi:hypothetical protein